jgi:phosphatidylglycerol:prolipoprotein diacylglycerol transferase
LINEGGIFLDSTLISFPIFGEGFLINAPRYISVFGFRIYLYGLFITIGFALAALYLLKRHEMFGLTKDNILDLVIMAVPCGLVGSRIYYILFNISEYFGPGKWQNIIMLREGGLAIYGGVIGGVVAILVYGRIKKIHYGKLLDAAGFGLFIGQAVGRWGNFFNREAYGIETEAPWRMGLTTGLFTTYVHPTFLYEMLWNAAGFLAMHIFSKKFKAKYHGQYFLLYVAWYGFGRFMIEGIRSDSLFISRTDIRVSQLLAVLSFSAAVVLLIHNYLYGKRDLEAGSAGSGDIEDSEDNGNSGNNGDSDHVNEDINKDTDEDIIEDANESMCKLVNLV